MRAVIGCSPEEAVAQLKQGNPVALPTETVYGLAAPLWDEDAILKIYTLKQRPLNNPFIVHVLDECQLDQVAYVNAQATKLINVFWPGPLTLILPKKPCVPLVVTAQQSSVAVRAPSSPLFRKVLELLGAPLVAPSANKFQQVSPTCAQHVMHGMGDTLSYILDGGPCPLGVESTILSLLNEQHPTLLRYGPIAKESIEDVLKQSVHIPLADENDRPTKLCPGLFKKHYSPHIPLYLVDKLQGFKPPQHLEQQFHQRAAHVFFTRPRRILTGKEFYLTENEDLAEAAANLFATLQHLDQCHFKSIWIETVPHKGIGYAINDRLNRAAHDRFP
ncbi:MAG: threonylcarbamoyl-AMP synthase [Puniceicoccales bacterium]|jgi:L-threonylcarbamoyladenylate synthase|nr:threonylcarbamoyl-AMP synthase [Puniceicoccales bacterium]